MPRTRVVGQVLVLQLPAHRVLDSRQGRGVFLVLAGPRLRVAFRNEQSAYHVLLIINYFPAQGQLAPDVHPRLWRVLSRTRVLVYGRLVLFPEAKRRPLLVQSVRNVVDLVTAS